MAVSVNNERAIPHAIAVGAKIFEALRGLRGLPGTTAGRFPYSPALFAVATLRTAAMTSL